MAGRSSRCFCRIPTWKVRGNWAEKLRQDIEYLMPDIGSTCLPITASIGVAEAKPHQQTVAEVQHQADECMYLAKRAGRNRVSTIDDGE
ncbi:hypothetical protein MCP1_40003 [Candidatus Terasakiella magnetica]|nr:hypothetical protein MCP1_40003 [Candidatus Terasakiella magnetica]